MKKILLFCLAVLMFAENVPQGSQEIEIPEKYEGYSSHIRWFASLGIGGLYNCNIDNVFLDNYLSMGFIIPYSDRISHYFSLDFDSVFLNDWGKKRIDAMGYNADQILTALQYRSSGGYTLNLSINYNFGYSVFIQRDIGLKLLEELVLGAI